MSLAREDMGDKEVKELRAKIREELPEIPGVKLALFGPVAIAMEAVQALFESMTIATRRLRRCSRSVAIVLKSAQALYGPMAMAVKRIERLFASWRSPGSPGSCGSAPWRSP